MQTRSKQECQSAISQHKTIRLLAPKSALSDLGPIVEAYYNCGYYPEIDHYHTAPNTQELTRVIGQSPDAVLYLTPARRAPSTLVDGPFLEKNGKRIPVGLLPVQNKESLSLFSASINAVNRREKEVLSVALLSQRHPRFIRLVDRMNACLPQKAASFKWTSSDLIREDMINGLGLGLGLSIYFGHGRPAGWVGYYGLRAHHFDSSNSQPLGAMLHLCCLTASRRKVGYSFAEKMVMQGVTSASFGAVKPTLHTDNTRWAVGLIKAIEMGAKNVSELLLNAVPLATTAYQDYRIIGDPLAPIFSSRKAMHFAQKLTDC